MIDFLLELDKKLVTKFVQARLHLIFYQEK